MVFVHEVFARVKFRDNTTQQTSSRHVQHVQYGGQTCEARNEKNEKK